MARRRILLEGGNCKKALLVCFTLACRIHGLGYTSVAISPRSFIRLPRLDIPSTGTISSMTCLKNGSGET